MTEGDLTTAKGDVMMEPEVRVMHFADGRMRPRIKECRQTLEAEKSKETDFSPEVSQRNAALLTPGF